MSLVIKLARLFLWLYYKLTGYDYIWVSMENEHPVVPDEWDEEAENDEETEFLKWQIYPIKP